MDSTLSNGKRISRCCNTTPYQGRQLKSNVSIPVNFQFEWYQKFVSKCSMKGRNHSNVNCVTTVVIRKVVCNSMLLQSMKGRNYSSVNCVTTALIRKVICNNMLLQSIKGRNHSNINFVTTVVIWMRICNNMLLQSMKGKKPFISELLTTVVIRKAVCNNMLLQFMKVKNSRRKDSVSNLWQLAITVRIIELDSSY